MPTLDFAAVKAQVVADLNEAWPDLAKIFLGDPLSEQKVLPFAVADLVMVPMAWNTARGLVQTWNWTFTKVMRTPSPGEDPVTERVEEANKLALVLERDELYADIGMLPHVSMVGVSEKEWVQARHHVAVGFTFQVEKTWGT